MVNGINSTKEIKPNTFQKYLVPAKSDFVRGALQKAGEWGKRDEMVFSHVLATALAICAVIFSVFNTLSYILHIPVKMLLNVIRFHPLNLIFDLVNDVSSALRSFLFVSFGVAFIVAGILFPAIVYPYFAPIDYENSKKILNNKIDSLTQENQKLTRQVEELQKVYENLLKNNDYINYLQNQVKKNELQTKKSWQFW